MGLDFSPMKLQLMTYENGNNGDGDGGGGGGGGGGGSWVVVVAMVTKMLILVTMITTMVTMRMTTTIAIMVENNAIENSLLKLEWNLRALLTHNGKWLQTIHSWAPLHDCIPQKWNDDVRHLLLEESISFGYFIRCRCFQAKHFS